MQYEKGTYFEPYLEWFFDKNVQDEDAIRELLQSFPGDVWLRFRVALYVRLRELDLAPEIQARELPEKLQDRKVSPRWPTNEDNLAYWKRISDNFAHWEQKRELVRQEDIRRGIAPIE